MLYLESTKYLGVRERYGKANSPEIMAFFKSAGHSWVNSEETPWCSAYMCHLCVTLGLPSTQSLRARSWLDVDGAETIDRIEDLRINDILILWRVSRDSIYGHVTLFGAHRDGRLHGLGGNQSNKVCSKPYPDYRFLSGRRFTPATLAAAA